MEYPVGFARRSLATTSPYARAWPCAYWCFFYYLFVPTHSQDSFVNDGPMSYETSSSQEETTPLRSQDEALGESELEKEGRGGDGGTHGDRKGKKRRRGVARFDNDEDEKVGVTVVMRLRHACSPRRTAKKGVPRDIYFPAVVRRGPRATKQAFPETKEGSRCLVLLTVPSKYLGLCGLPFVMSSSMLARFTFLCARHPLAVPQGYVPAALGAVSADGPLVPPRPPRGGQRADTRELLWKGPGRWRRWRRPRRGSIRLYQRCDEARAGRRRSPGRRGGMRVRGRFHPRRLCGHADTGDANADGTRSAGG